ncbi:MAG TPA: CBS domain-containing protein, partial [Anaeromyxobacteraceae bacterium]|nr:CBS domain-containing protein [Anaeromyxobacteraceae bacterium]
MPDAMPFEDVPVQRVMTANPISIEPEASLAEAAGALLRGGFRHLPVVDPAGRPVGMVSERDLRARLGTDLYGFSSATVEALSEPASGVMTPDPVSVQLGARLAEVIDTFADERVGALLVVDEADRVRGIVSYVDLLLWLRDHPAGGPPPAGPVAARPKAGKPARARPKARSRTTSR